MIWQRDDFKAGVFVIVGVIVTLLIIVILSDLDRLLEKQQDVKVYYALSDGVKGLKPGAPVTLGDQSIGTVTAIKNAYEDSRVVGKRITISLPEQIELCRNAAIELVEPPLGSGTRLNIRSVGSGERYDPKIDIAGQLAGSPLTKSLVRDFGIEEVQRRQLRRIIGDLGRFTKAFSDSESKQPVPAEIIARNIADASEALPDAVARVSELLDSFQPLTDDARISMADLKQATADIKAIAADFRSVTGEFKARSDGWWERVGSVTTSAVTTMDMIETLVRDKDPQVRQTLDAVHQISVQVRDQTMAQVSAALVKADEAIENARRATAEMQLLVAGQRPVLERAIANAQITTGQLKLAAIEIRRAPWRLLYKPSDDELETDNLYDAARSFALAAGTLDSAALSLRAVAGGTGGTGGESKQKIDQMLDRLERLFGKFEQAEGAFWKALVPAGAKPPASKRK
jgi:ABC-type transporter Mla subunit MlaD